MEKETGRGEEFISALSKIAFEAEVECIAQMRGKQPDDYLDWDYHQSMKTPASKKSKAIALAVEQAVLGAIRDGCKAMHDSEDLVLASETWEAGYHYAYEQVDRALAGRLAL